MKRDWSAGIVFLCISAALTGYGLHSQYHSRNIEYGTKHPTLDIKAQPALCDWKVWFEEGSQPAYVQALDEFSSLTGLPWVEVEKDWEATVMVSEIKGQNLHIFGTALRTPDLKWRAQIRINDWGLPIQRDRSRVMLHEVLHIFGLFHSPSSNSLMYAEYNPDQFLTNTDIENIRLLAGTCQ